MAKKEDATPMQTQEGSGSAKIAIKGDPSKPSAWNSLNVAQLKVHLKDQELNQDGNKTDLIERLVVHFEAKKKKDVAAAKAAVAKVAAEKAAAAKAAAAEAAAAKAAAAKVAAAEAAKAKAAKIAAQKANVKPAAKKENPATQQASGTPKKNGTGGNDKQTAAAGKLEPPKKAAVATEKKNEPKKAVAVPVTAAKYIEKGGTVPNHAQMKKETNSVRMQHSIAAYPISMDDMNHPKVLSAVTKCKTFGVRFYRLEEEVENVGDFIGCLQISFKEITDTLEALDQIKEIREGLTVYQMGGKAGNQTQLIGRWNKMIENVSGVDSKRHKPEYTMFIPNPPSDMEMGKLAEMFSDVEEAIIFDEDNVRHAWVMFKNEEGFKKATALVKAEKGAGGCTFDGYCYKELMNLSETKAKAKGVVSATGTRGSQAQGTRGQTTAPAARGRGSTFGVRGSVVPQKTSLIGQGVNKTQTAGRGSASTRGVGSLASRPRGLQTATAAPMQSLLRLKENAQQRHNLMNMRRGRPALGGVGGGFSSGLGRPDVNQGPTADYQMQQGPRAADRHRPLGQGIGNRNNSEVDRLRQDPVPLPLSLSQLIPGVMDQPQQPSRDMGHSTGGGSGGFNSLLGVPPESGMRGGADRIGRTSDQHSRQWSSGSGGAMAGLGADSTGGYGGDLPNRDFRQSGGSGAYGSGGLNGSGSGAYGSGTGAYGSGSGTYGSGTGAYGGSLMGNASGGGGGGGLLGNAGGGGRGMRGDSGFRGGDGARMGDPTPAVKEDPIYARSLAMMGSSDYGAQPGAARRKQSRWDGDALQDDLLQPGLLGSPPKRRMDNTMAMDPSPKRLRGNDDFGYQAGRQDTSYQLGGRGVDNNDLQGGVGGGDLYGGRRDNYDLGGRDGDGGRVGDPTPTPAVKEDPIYARSLAMLGGSDHGAQGQDPQQRRGAGKRKPSLSEGEAHPSEHIGGKRKPDMEDNRNYPALLSPVRARVTSPMAIAHSPRRIHDDDDFRCQAGRQSYPLAGRTEGHRFHGDVVGGDASMSDSRRQPYDLGGQDAAHDMYSTRATDTGITGLRSSKHDLYSPVGRDRDLGGLGSVKHDLAGAVGRDRDLGGLGSLKHDLAGAIGRDRDLGGPGSLKHDLAGAVGRATDGGLYGRATQDFDLRGLETNRRETEPLGRDQPAGRDRDWGWRGGSDFEDQLQGYGNRSQPQDRLGLPVDDSRVLGYGIGRDRRHDNYDTRSGTGYSSGLMDGMVGGGGGGGGQMAMYRTRDPALTPTDGPAVSGGLQSTDASGYWSTSAVALDDRVAAGRCAVETSFWDRGKEVESERGGAETGWHGEGVVDQRHKRNTRDEIGWKGEATIDQRHKRNAGGDSVPWQSY